MNSSSKIFSWITHSYNKMRADFIPDADTKNEYTVYMAKGETEGCQIAVRSEKPLDRLTLKLASEGVNGIKCEMFSMNRTHIVNSLPYTDSTIEYDGSELSIDGEQTVPFVVEFTVPSDFYAGDCDFVFEMKNGSELISVFNVRVHIWNFVLPEKKTFETAVGISTWHINRVHGYCDEALYKAYYDKLLEHNMSAYNLPYDILDDRSDEYMSNPKVTSFVVPHSVNDEKLLSYYNKLSSNEDWLGKALFYPLDEPREPRHLTELQELSAHLKRICPKIRISSPFYLDLQTGEGTDQVDHMSQYIDLWCPKLCLWDDNMAYNRLDYKPAPFADRMASMKARGDKMWTYVCNDPIHPYIAMFVDVAGLDQRVIFWQQYQRNIDGFLYWSSNAWGYHGKTTDPWEDLFNGVGDGEGNPVYGEGLIFYPGNKLGFEGPVTSLRMKIMRDGIDDCEMFYLATKYLGDAYVKEKINRVTSNLTTINVNNDEFASIRIEIGNDLEKAIVAQG